MDNLSSSQFVCSKRAFTVHLAVCHPACVSQCLELEHMPKFLIGAPFQWIVNNLWTLQHMHHFHFVGPFPLIATTELHHNDCWCHHRSLHCVCQVDQKMSTPQDCQLIILSNTNTARQTSAFCCLTSWRGHRWCCDIFEHIAHSEQVWLEMSLSIASPSHWLIWLQLTSNAAKTLVLDWKNNGLANMLAIAAVSGVDGKKLTSISAVLDWNLVEVESGS